MLLTLMKKCTKCGGEHPLASFYKNSKLRGGRANICKECHKASIRANQKKRIEYYLEYSRKRKKCPVYQAAQRAYRHSASGRAAKKKANLRYERKNPGREKANKAVAYALKTGLLIKKSCTVCGTTKSIHGHHEDYSKPLDIIWLCALHHSEVHRP